MKKTVNKWLLLFASIFLMTAVACSNSTGGGDNKDKGSDTGDTPETPQIPIADPPTVINDDTYNGIKIRIADIPTETYARRIYVNDRVAGEDFSYGDNGALITNQYAKKSEWGYPFVQADKSYKIVVEFIGADYQTIKKTEPLNITAKKGLGELKCPNAEYVVEDNILKFKKGAPVIYYGNNTNIKEYSNKKSGPSYAIQVFSDGWADNQYFWFGGEDLSQNTFDFARNLKKELVTDNKLLLRVWAGIEDKDYGGYVYQIAYDKHFYLDLDKFPKDFFDITQYIPSNDDLKGKVLQEVSKSQYIEFASAEDSKGYLPATMYACSVKTSGSSSGGTTTSYEWHETKFFYKDGKLDFGETDLTLIGDGPGLYCALAPATRVSGEGIYGTFNVWGNTISLSEDGTYSTSGTKGYYEFEDGIICFKDGILQGNIAIYDGKTFYLGMFFYTAIDKLPAPLPDPAGFSNSTSPSTNVDETGAPYAKLSEVTPTNSDLSGKIFHFSTNSKAGPRDLFFQFESEGNDPYSPLNVTMYPYGIESNGEYDGPYGQTTYSYSKGTLSSSTSTSGAVASAYQIFRVNKKYYVSPNGSSFKRIENTGKGLYCSFYISGATLSLSKEGKYTLSITENNNETTGTYTNTNGVITLENKNSGNQELLYDGDSLYLLIDFIQADSLPANTGNSSGSGEGADYTYLSGTYTATVTMTNTKTDENGQEIQETETSNDTLSVDLDEKAFIWTKEFDDGCIWFSGNLKIQKNQDTQADELILSCTKQAETSSFSEKPQDTVWQSVNADIYASFTKNTITIYAEDAVVTETDAEGNILPSGKVEKVQLPNPIIFDKIEG